MLEDRPGRHWPQGGHPTPPTRSSSCVQNGSSFHHFASCESERCRSRGEWQQNTGAIPSYAWARRLLKEITMKPTSVSLALAALAITTLNGSVTAADNPIVGT